MPSSGKGRLPTTRGGRARPPLSGRYLRRRHFINSKRYRGSSEPGSGIRVDILTPATPSPTPSKRDLAPCCVSSWRWRRKRRRFVEAVEVFKLAESLGGSKASLLTRRR